MTVESTLDEIDRAIGRAGSDRQPKTSTSLLELWQIARIRFRVVFGSALAIFVLICIAMFSITPLYTGNTVVMLDPRQRNIVDVQAVLSSLSGDQTTILTQVQIIQSENLASRVATKLKLDQDPEFNPALRHSIFDYLSFLDPRSWVAMLSSPLTQEQEEAKTTEAIITKFERRLSVSQIGLSSAIQISFSSESPQKAAEIANAIGDAYVEDQLDAKFDATKKATQWLAGRLGELATQAAAAQSAVEKYKTDHHLTEVVGQQGSGLISVLDQQIAQASTQLMQAQTDQQQAESTAAHVKALVAAGHADEVNQVISSTLIGNLRSQEAQLVQQIAQMSSRYGPEYPKMLDLQAEKRDLEAKINEEIAKVVATTDNDAAVARGHEAALRAQLSQLEEQSGIQGQDRVRLNQLEANAGSARSLYDAFVARSKQTQEEEGLQVPDSRVITVASIPLTASFPKKSLVLGGGLLASILCGFGLALILERLDNGFRISSRAEEMLGLPVFATLPNVEAGSSETSQAAVADLVVDRPLSAFTEAIRGLQMGISLSNVDKAPRVILLTSALPGEGKTTTALSLARHIAQTGQRVIVVDADLRRPNIKNLIEKIDSKSDLVAVLRGTIALEQAVISDAKGQADILPVLTHVKNAPDLIGSEAMASIIARLRSNYDYVIIDSAPILPVNDTKILSRLADAVVFIIRWEQTPRTAALDAIKALREVRANVVGVALTRADTKRYHYYSFGYGSYRYSYGSYYEDRPSGT